MDLLIKNGTVVNGSQKFKADVAVEDGKITQIGINIEPSEGTKIVNAAGKLVLPGAICRYKGCSVRRHNNGF